MIEKIASSEAYDELEQSENWTQDALNARGKAEIPRRLFKFMPPGEHFIENVGELILRNRVRLSSRASFNDPFDTRVPMDFPATSAEAAAFIAGYVGRNPGADFGPDANTDVSDPAAWAARGEANANSGLDQWGICSFCDTVNQPLMWAHYAGSHMGIAAIVRVGWEMLLALPLQYHLERPRLDFRGSHGVNPYLFLVKGQPWAYEGEWRLIEPGRASQYFELPYFALRGIVLGINAAPGTYEFVMNAVVARARLRLPALEIYRAEADDTFDIGFSQLESTGWTPVDANDDRFSY